MQVVAPDWTHVSPKYTLAFDVGDSTWVSDSRGETLGVRTAKGCTPQFVDGLKTKNEETSSRGDVIYLPLNKNRRRWAMLDNRALAC